MGGALLLTFVVLANPAVVESARYLYEPKLYPTQPTIYWAKAADELQKRLDQSDVVLTTNGTYMLYYFGRFDVEVSKNIVSQTESGTEFARDSRTGRILVSEPASLRQVISCFQTGMFVGHVHQWRHRVNGISVPAAKVLAESATEVVTPPQWRLKVYYWEREADTETQDESCTALRGLITNASGKSNRGI